MDSAERRQQGERREGDRWLTRTLNVFAIVAALSTVAFYGVPLVGVPKRVEALEQHNVNEQMTQPWMVFMTCGLYRKAYPDQLPPPCDKSTKPATQ